MIGYHHVLMLIIAVAIILLCESFGISVALECTNLFSLIIGRMLLIISTNPQHIPHIDVL